MSTRHRHRHRHAAQAPSGLPDYLPAHLQAHREHAPADELRLLVSPLAFERAVRLLRGAGARFITLLLAQRPEPSLIAVLALRGDLVVLRASTGGVAPVKYGSIGAQWPAARWAEQELVERESVAPVGFSADRPLTAPDADRLDRRLAGLDVFALPYGPVRSGIFEAIQFVIETGGENMPALQTRPYFKHRGMESRFVGLTPDGAVCVAERVAGIASVAYACAFSHAVERALDVAPTAGAERWRAVYAELERIACHLDVIAKQAETTALSVAQARFQILKEQVMRLRARLTGSRFGRGVIVPGGVRGAGAVALNEILAELDRLERDFDRDRRLFLGTASMVDRLIGSGLLAREKLDEYGAVGPLARGSGLSVDARHERPYGEYRRLGLRVVTDRGGDAMARVNVRFGEIDESLRILRQAIDHLRRHDGELSTALPSGASGSAFGWTEAPQGELVVWVEIQGGLLRRVQIASPSLRNWALFDHAFPNDVLTDFAFIEHSFGLTPAGADR
jgi:Ni,Fe-hydrogenase III large subunit